MTAVRPSRFVPTLMALEGREVPAAGSLDPTFGSGGIGQFSGLVTDLAVAPDGDIFVVTGNAVQRFDADGTPDMSFGVGGSVSPGGLALPSGAEFSAVTVLPDGTTYVGGRTLNYLPDGALWGYRTVVARVTPAGNLDPAFGAGGVSFVGPGSPGASVYDIITQPDGRLLLIGARSNPDPTVPAASAWFDGMVDRLTAAGQLDPTFGPGGEVVFPGFAAAAAAVQPDGRIVLAGTAGGDPHAPAAVRLTADGRLDPTFGTAGRMTFAFPGQVYGQLWAVGAQPDGRILLAGEVSQTRGAVGAAARLTADGRLDPSYDGDGMATTAAVGYDRGRSFFAAAVDPLGRAVFSTDILGPDNLYNGGAVFRLTAGGAADTGFGTNGVVTKTDVFGRPDNSATLPPGLAVQPNGDVVLAGSNGLGSDGGPLVRLLGSEPLAGFVPPAAGTVTAGGPTNGTLAVFTPAAGAYAAAATVTPFPGLGGAVRSATADVTGDGTPDYVTGAGPGGLPQVSVYDGRSGNLVTTWLPFESSFAGGVFVAAADLDGDGRAEVVVTPDQGGGPRVTVFSISPGGAATLRANFFGIDDPAFRGGARPALGDVDGDGTPDLAVAAGFLGGPRTALFRGTTLLGGSPTRLISDFLAFDGSDAVNLRNGVFVAIGDLTGDGAGELIFGGGPGGAPRVFALSGQLVAAGNVAGAQAAPVSNFFVGGNVSDRGGVRVGVADADADGRADLLAGSGAGSPARVRVYLGKNVLSASEPGTAQDLAPFGGAVLTDGVFVG